MKKFINPEMNINRFDCENIVATASITAEDAAKDAIATGGVQIGGTTYDGAGVQSITITF